MSNRKLSATMKPDLDGRTVLGLQPRHKALSETYREKSSDLAILELDHVLCVRVFVRICSPSGHVCRGTCYSSRLDREGLVAEAQRRVAGGLRLRAGELDMQ